MYKLDLEKAEEPEIKLPTWITEKVREFQKNIYFCFIDYAKPLCGSQQTVKNSKRDENTRPPYLTPENLCVGQKVS